MMKRCFLLILTVALCLCCAACGGGSDDAVITLPEESISMSLGQSYQLEYSIEPENTPVTYSSSNADVVTVDEKGLVQAVGNGSATVAISAGDYSKAYLEVSVSADTMTALTNVILGSKTLEMITGTEFDLSCTVNKGGQLITDTAVTWTSSDEAVAKVTDGTVQAVAPGQAVVTAAVTVDGETAQANCNVTVYEYYKIQLDKQSVYAPIGAQIKLAATVYDANGQQVVPGAGELELITSDPSAIQVQSDSFKVISIGTPSIGVRYKGNVASIPVEIFSVTADFFSNSTKDFYGEVSGQTFSGVLFESVNYQPYIYFTEAGAAQIKAYAADNGYTTLRIHSYAILKNNQLVINGKYTGALQQWATTDVSVSSLSADFYFWSQSEGTTEVYMWFEFL